MHLSVCACVWARSRRAEFGPRRAFSVVVFVVIVVAVVVVLVLLFF